LRLFGLKRAANQALTTFLEGPQCSRSLGTNAIGIHEQPLGGGILS